MNSRFFNWVETLTVNTPDQNKQSDEDHDLIIAARIGRYEYNKNNKLQADKALPIKFIKPEIVEEEEEE